MAEKYSRLLIRRFLKAGYVYGGDFVETEKGTPQGGNLSPMLSNVCLVQYQEDATAIEQVIRERFKKFRMRCKEMNAWLKSVRNVAKVKEWWPDLVLKQN